MTALGKSAPDRRPAGSAVPAVTPNAAPALDSGVVVGEVRDAARRPLGAATVVVVGTGLSATTDDSGRFTLRGVPAGAATLRARRVGYGAGTTALAVAAAETTRATLELTSRALSMEAVAVTGKAATNAAVADAAPAAGAPPVPAAPAGGSAASAPRAQGAMRSERRVRRTGAQGPDVRGCFAITPVADSAARVAPRAAPPSPVRLGDGGDVLADGAVRGTWTLVGADSLRIAWTHAGLRALALRRDGAGWVGSGVRLAPAVDGERCRAP